MENGKLHIAMVAQHGCIRVIKESLALMKRGHIVDLIANQVPFGYHFFDTPILYNDKNQLRRIILNSSADIFHVHNEPDWLVAATREVSKGRPVIYDVHDLESLRWHNHAEGEEVEAFAAADGIIHVSEPIREFAEKEHGNGLPSRVIYCWMDEQFVSSDKDIIKNPSFQSIVYEGGIDSKSKPQPYENSPQKVVVNIRNLTGIFAKFREQGFAVTIFAATPQQQEAYEMMGIYVGQPVMYPAMLSGLRPHGLGFVGCPINTPLMQLAMPNKLFEYMSQGVVPICYNAKEAGKFVTEHKCGVNLESLDNLKDQIGDVRRLRKNVLKLRNEFLMSKQVEQIESLYEEVLNGGK